MHNVHQEPLLKCWLHVLVIGNEKDTLQHIPNSSFVNDLRPFLAINEYAIVFIRDVLEGVSQVSPNSVRFQSGAHKNTLNNSTQSSRRML